jgi:hypothetical protein
MSKTVNLVSRRDNVYENRDIEMVFAVTCLLYIPTLYFSLYPCKYPDDTQLLAMFVEAVSDCLSLHLCQFSLADN